jgi:serine/threonine-protein kinase
MKVADLGAEPPTLRFTGDDPVTLVPDTLSTPLPAMSGALISEDPTTITGTYALGGVIGRGGMGEIMLAHDKRIGRDVALKRLRSTEPTDEDVSRFLREARIQARLDHPAIVPVYELARDATGRPYFTMKRVAGQTLVEVLTKKSATRQRLLRAFADVCRAVDFAHSRGVVHRDLKPANIVLGEFGEVYVLDWGIARVVGDTGEVVTADIDTLEGSAPAGHILGTPGYIAPEQVASPDVGLPADVYALGAILFELLAGQPLHPRGQQLAIASTMGDATPTSPAARRPDRSIPPELDALCFAMLSKSIASRPTARACADRIEEYLDGDRDVARRRSMAIDLVWQARAALEADQRNEAMATASRALALDPQVAGAAEIVTRLMLEPPRTTPPELRDALREADAADISRHAKAAIPGYVLMAGFLPLIIWNGVLKWWIVMAMVVSALGMAVAAVRLMRSPLRSFGWMALYAVGNAVVMVMLSRIAGPFTFVPALVSFITASLITYPTFLERPWVLTGIMLGGFLLPIGLEATNIIPSTWDMREGGILMQGNAMNLAGAPALFTTLLASTATVVMAGIQSSVLGRANRAAQHKLVAQAWQLSHLLPSATRAATYTPPSGVSMTGLPRASSVS